MSTRAEFSLPAKITKVRADVFALTGKSLEDSFVVGLALAYNDLRVTLWTQRMLADAKEIRDRGPEGEAEWRGLLIHSQRQQVAIINEILQALKKAADKGLLTHMFWRYAIDEMRSRAPAAFGYWQDLVAVARKSDGTGGSGLRTFLAKVRSHVVYHYDQPGPLLKGFQAAYQKESAQIAVSYGRGPLQTRFCFADEAAARVLYDSDVLPGGYREMSPRIREVHTALRFFIECYLSIRQQYLDAQDLADIDELLQEAGQ